MFAKSADQQAPPQLDIMKYGWDIRDGIPMPATSASPPAPFDLMHVVWCGCKAEGKVCTTTNCSCHHVKTSCTLYCACGCSDKGFNPHKTVEDSEGEVEEGSGETDEDINESEYNQWE